MGIPPTVYELTIYIHVIIFEIILRYLKMISGVGCGGMGWGVGVKLKTEAIMGKSAGDVDRQQPRVN